MAGTLFVVATPIGNLEDLTFRALRTLKEVDFIAAEDTRRTAKLLAHYEIRKPMVSLHEHNEHRETPRLVKRLVAGESAALVSDAGTPGIADPGATLVATARLAGVRVTPVPGPSAVTAALSAAGVPADQFVFMGFVPRSGSARQTWFDRVAAEQSTVVFFESPHRAERTMTEAAETLGNRQILWFRELTKYHEQLVITTINAELAASGRIGEYVVVVGPAPEPGAKPIHQTDVVEMFRRLTETSGFSDEVAVRIVAHVLGAAPGVVRKSIKKHRISMKQQSRPRP